MAVTSANISGQSSPTTADEVFAQLNGRIAMIIDGGPTRGGIPSTLVDCTKEQIEVLREGPISKEQLLNAI
jgi:L-threonylcarbamoyladenylate synthase